MRTRHRLTVVLVLAPLLLVGPGRAQEGSDFFDSDFDGGWVGTIASGPDRYPLQVMLNVRTGEAVGTIFALEAPEEVVPEGAAPIAFSPAFGKVKTKKVIASFEPVEEEGERPSTATTLILKYKTATDTLAGRSRGATRGRLALVRMTPERPLQRLWAGQIQRDGSVVTVLLQLEQTPQDGRRPGSIDAVSGRAWVGDEQGAVEGTLTGARLEVTLKIPSGDASLQSRLKRKNGQLVGSLEIDGGGRRLKLLPTGSNNGKPMKAAKVDSGELAAGDTGIVTIKGRNFGTGALVHADDPAVEVLGVDLVSARRLDTVVRVGGEVAAGTNVALRVVNGDGQSSDRPNGFEVGDEGGGGGGGGVSFASAVQPIFSTSCATAGCHSSGSAAAGLVLASGSAFANLVNVPSSQRPELDRIEPGNPDTSYLVMKIRGDSGIQGGRMPLNRTPLTQSQVDTIVNWVLEGAADNGPDGH